MKICKVCGSINSEHSKYCESCGLQLDQVDGKSYQQYVATSSVIQGSGTGNSYDNRQDYTQQFNEQLAASKSKFCLVMGIISLFFNPLFIFSIIIFSEASAAYKLVPEERRRIICSDALAGKICTIISICISILIILFFLLLFKVFGTVKDFG